MQHESMDEEERFQHSLYDVAQCLAYEQEMDYRKSSNEDPEGEGYAFYAAENMMSEFDYFRTNVWKLTDEFVAELAQKSRAEQELLVAWHQQLCPESER